MGLFVVVRDSSGAMIDLGSDAMIDTESSAGRSIYGTGSMVPLSHQQTFQEPFGNAFLNQFPCVLLSFTDDIAGALNYGVRSGCYLFTGQRDRLMLRPGKDFAGASDFTVTIYSLSMKRLSRFQNRLSLENDA